MSAMVDFMVSRICQIDPLRLLVNHFEPIRDITKLTTAATGIEGHLKNIPGTVLWTTPTPQVNPCRVPLRCNRLTYLQGFQINMP